MAHQVGEEEHGALEDADHDQVPPGVVVADLAPQLGHPPLQILAGDQGLSYARLGHRAQSR